MKGRIRRTIAITLATFAAIAAVAVPASASDSNPTPQGPTGCCFN